MVCFLFSRCKVNIFFYNMQIFSKKLRCLPTQLLTKHNFGMQIMEFYYFLEVFPCSVHFAPILLFFYCLTLVKLLFTPAQRDI